MSESDRWHWHPSAAFDALCLLALLADIPFYVSRHADDARQWQGRLREAGGRALPESLDLLRRRVNDEAGKPMPAFLALWVSPAIGPDDGLDLGRVIGLLADGDALPGMMRQRSAHWNSSDDALFREIQPALETALRGLLDLGYASWWERHARPALLARCGELARELADTDVIALVQANTGLDLGSDHVEVCVLRWAAPHAIRVTGVRFLADIRYDSSITLANAVHELLHPPWPAGHPVKDQLDDLARDPFLAAKFGARDPAAGYNSWAAYAEEDAAQALDQYLIEKLGCARADARTRWTTADGGMHALAWLIYDALTGAGAAFEPRRESYADFLQRVVSDRLQRPAGPGG
jgi:hypothetical protein